MFYLICIFWPIRIWASPVCVYLYGQPMCVQSVHTGQILSCGQVTENKEVIAGGLNYVLFIVNLLIGHWKAQLKYYLLRCWVTYS